MFPFPPKEWTKRNEIESGPWTYEPDSDFGIDRGVQWAILRHPNLGHLCGYIGVPSESLPPGKENDFEVHGGVTFDQKGDDNDLFWIGFDCSHSWDYVPGLPADFRFDPPAKETYKQISYVKNEITNLITQYLEKKANPMQHVSAYSDLIAQARARLEEEEALSGTIDISLRVSFRNHSGEAEVRWTLSHNYKDAIYGPDLMELIDIYMRRWKEDEARTVLKLSRS